jgi:VanZ family protein
LAYAESLRLKRQGNSLMKFFKLWVPVILWAAVIFFISSIPYLRSDLDYDFILRKIAHILEYFIFTFLLYRAYRGSFKIDIFRLFTYPMVSSFIYAVSDEIHQSFVPGRNCSYYDLLIDTAGILSFYITIKILQIK